jgi:stage II sporulation protein GA (sporulation sigma-E factor processing peptidase)
METIYIDQLFFINFIIDYFTLLCSGKVTSAVIRRVPIALAATLGGCYACVCMLPEWTFALHPVIKLTVGVVMCLISFGKETQLLRCTVVFFLVSAGFGGLVWAVSMLGGYDLSGKTVYLPLNWKVLVLSFAAAYVVISALFRRFDPAAAQDVKPAQVTLCGKTAEFSVLRDTGNSLFDPISNESVLVCQQLYLAPLFNGLDIDLSGDPAAVIECLSRAPGLQGRVRLIPYNSVGGAGLLPAFRPDALIIGGKPVSNTLIAMTGAQFSTYGEYQGIY